MELGVATARPVVVEVGGWRRGGIYEKCGIEVHAKWE